MRVPFRPGDQKVYQTQVTSNKVAQFQGQIVHPFYSTFALAQDAEWACRLFVLDMKDPDEEGIGTYLSIHHVGAVPIGEKVDIVATLLWVRDATVHCAYEVWWADQRVAYGEQTQKILKKR
ncbi:MAG: hypothetical protein RMK19_05385 [Bacteroidia bacterium]|nr:hypothetical protein [Bacteroidia bacterium]MDW8015426.1 hypothetical protein [Bacteroidia bacterium]